MRVLIIDTRRNYVQWLQGFLSFTTGLSALNPVEVEVTEKVSRGIKALMNKEYDLLFLRHDLDQEPKNGSDVREFLKKHPDVNPGMMIVCHGVNAVSDHKNAAQLTTAGRLARWFPIGLLPAWKWEL